MGIKLIKEGRNKGKKRFIFETDDERKILEDARNYFGESSALLIIGWGRKLTSKRSACPRFYAIRKGKHPKGSGASISIEEWKRTQEYASRYNREERYDPETFERPEF